jgi:hypothetical protein
VRDAPFPVRRERVAVEAGRIGAQHLNCVRAPPGLVVGGRLWQGPGRHRAHVVGAVVELADWAGQVQDAAGVPALPESVLEVVHGVAAHLGLDVVPGWPRAISAGEGHHLRIARVLRVVIAAVAKVDSADECDVAGRRAGMTHHDQLLVMAACPAGPGIEQHLTSVLVDLPDELRVGLLGLLQQLGMRAPQQAEDQDFPARGQAEHLPDLGPWTIESLVQVPPEVQEIHLIPRPGRRELGTQPGEVAAAIHERLHQVSCGEGPEISSRVGSITLGEEPRRDRGVVGR